MGHSSPADWSLSDSKIVTPEQAHAIIAEARRRAEVDQSWDRDADWFTIALKTGLRLSEVGHIEKSDILEKRLLVTRRKKRKLHPEPISVMPSVLELIRKRAEKVESGWIFPGEAQPCVIHRQSKKNGPSVEQVCCGGHTSLRTIQRKWRILLTDLGIYQHGRGIHSLRHTAITAIYKLTKDLRKAQVYAGHSSSAITEKYAKVLDLEESLEKMEDVL